MHSGITCQPNGPWVEQQARNLVMELAERGEKASCLIKDGDTKFTGKFDHRSEGIKVKKLPFASPNLNAYAERFVQSIKSECLEQFVVFGERHLEFLIREYEQHYNTVRPHQGNRTIGIVPINHWNPHCQAFGKWCMTHVWAGSAALLLESGLIKVVEVELEQYPLKIGFGMNFLHRMGRYALLAKELHKGAPPFGSRLFERGRKDSFHSRNTLVQRFLQDGWLPLIENAEFLMLDPIIDIHKMSLDSYITRSYTRA